MSDQEVENEIVIADGAMQGNGLETAGGSTVTGLSSAYTVPVEPRDESVHQGRNSVPEEIVFSAIYSERHGELPIEEQLREAQRALELERMITQLQEAKAEIDRLQSGRSPPRSRRSPPRSQRSTPQSGLRDEDGDRGNDSSGENSVESAIESIRSQFTQKSIAQ